MKLLLQSLLTAGISAIAFSALAEKQQITVWKHQSVPEESEAIQKVTDDFNASQDQYEATITLIPEATYTESFTSAAIANKLPCVAFIDQPLAPNFAYHNYIQPLKIDPSITAQLLSGAKTKYNGEIYAIGMWDVAETIFTRQSYLDKYDIRKATIKEPYTKDEFIAILKKLKDSGDFKFPLEIKTAWKGEWVSYGFGPWLASFGGDLINRETFLEAENILNGKESLEFGNFFQMLGKEGYVDKNSADDQSFLRSEVAFDYNGSWAVDNYKAAFGDDLVIMPVPDFGGGPKIGSGSWAWAVSSSCQVSDGAFAYIEYFLKPENIAYITDITGLIPVTEEAAQLTEIYNNEGEGRIFYEYAKRYALERPATPAYKVITSAVEKSFRDILNGADVQGSLDAAVDEIEADLEANNFYGMKK